MTVLATVLALATASVDTTSYCLQGRMADGSWVRPGSAAHNGLPLGTRITITPPAFGRRRWVVRDRIGWGTTLDLWAPSCSMSIAFGRRTVALSVGWQHRRYRASWTPKRPRWAPLKGPLRP